MKDVTSEPVQYQVHTRTLRRAAAVAASVAGALVLIFGLFIPLLLSLSRYRLGEVRQENQSLQEIATRYRVSDERLAELSRQVGNMEDHLAQSRKQTLALISGMEKDLRRWLPEGGVGGGEQGRSLSVESARLIQLSPSQISQVKNLEKRLAELDQHLELFDQTLVEVEQSWSTRNALFSALPSFWPVASNNVTSQFGMRIHPISRRYQLHEGIDVSAPVGTRIYATAPGTVSFSGYMTGYGYCLIIDHGYGLSTFYAHCRTLLVNLGQKVKKGQLVAEVGTSGYSTGPHLHFEVRVSGIPVDPLQYLSIYSPKPAD